MSNLNKIPVTILTGFLGAGKTTLIRSLIVNNKSKRLAVIINEFGDLGVDGEIIKECSDDSCPIENILELANGCICCTVADDFVPTMKLLLEGKYLPDHILIETSGLALPKPLLKVNDKPLIEHLIVRLVEGGITGVVVNHYYLGEMIEKVLGDGTRFGIEILYSKETTLLETGGGVINSLGKLKDESFIVVNADIWTDFNFASLKQIHEDKNLAHLILVENVAHNLKGDFYINKAGLVSARPSTGAACLTFSGISVLHRKLFEGHKNKVSSLRLKKVKWEKNENGQLELKDLKGSHSEIDIKADLVLLAMGFLHPKKDKLIEKLGLDLDERGNVKANDFDYKTNQKKIFVSGDMRRGQSLVVWAIREGRQVAHSVDKFLMGKTNLPY